MKNILLFFLIALLMDGVFSESVSVTEGDSVTLHTDLTEIQKNDVIQWRFKTTLIAQFNTVNTKISTYDLPNVRFKDRVELNLQTGSLTITNITNKHAGDYEVSNLITLKKSFIVSVVFADAVKPVSVLEGDSVTLRTGLTDIHDVIQWRSDHQNSPVAEIDRKAGIFNTSDGRFTDKLQLDCLTGSLTIRNIGTRHSGLYKADISSSKHTIHKTFNVTVRDAVMSVPVMEGKNVTLQTNVTEIQKDDQILWIFGDIVIAEINKAAQQFYIYDVPDYSFKGRLKLNNQTGSLNITNATTTDSGLYELKISSSRYIILRRITVTVSGDSGLSPAAKALIVFGVLLVVATAVYVIYHCCKISQPKLSCKTLSVIEGETVPLHPSGTEIIKEDNIRWLFNKSPLAQIKRNPPAPVIVLLDRFKQRLDWNENLGPLIIKNIQIKDSGFYELQIIRSENNIQTLEIFSVTVYAKTDQIKIKEAKEGGSVTLETGVTGIQKDDEILWKFGLEYSHIAAIQGGKKKTPTFGAGWRYRCRLKLDENGSLTIRNIRPLDTGFYVLHITRRGNTSLHLFIVKISNPSKPEEMRLMSVGTSNS